MYRYIVYIRKATSGLEMRYGIYNTFGEARDKVKFIKSVNTVDEVYIDELFIRPCPIEREPD